MDSSHRLVARPSRGDVIQAFRLILGREPENEIAIAAHMQMRTVSDLRQTLLNSEEFKGKFRTMQPDTLLHPNFSRSRRAVVFIHLQKTGGTSLRHVIGSQFAPERRCPIFEDKLHVLSVAELARFDFFAGHFDISATRLIPRDEVHTIAMFREPSARLISFYRFLRSHPAGDEFAGEPLVRLAHELTAEEFFERPELRANATVNNNYLIAFGRSFAWFEQNYGSFSKGSFDSMLFDAKLQIRALAGLAITERFQESVELICRTLRMDAPNSIPKLHVTDNFPVTNARFRMVEPVKTTPRLTEAIQDLVEYDQIIYKFAVEEFVRRQTGNHVSRELVSSLPIHG